MEGKGDKDMANESNLIPGGHEFTQEEASKGGKASAEARRRKKTFKDVFEALMSEDIGVNIPKPQHIANANGISVQEAIAITVAVKAVNGDLSAAGFVRDTLGEKPTEKMDIDSDNKITVNIKEI